MRCRGNTLVVAVDHHPNLLSLPVPGTLGKRRGGEGRRGGKKEKGEKGREEGRKGWKGGGDKTKVK